MKSFISPKTIRALVPQRFGDYRNIALAPASVQEIHDLVQLAFYLADKYRSPVIVVTDAILGQMMERLELRGLSENASN